MCQAFPQGNFGPYKSRVVKLTHVTHVQNLPPCVGMLNAAWFTIGMKKRGTESHLRLLWLPFTIRTKKRRSDIDMVQRTKEGIIFGFLP